jgi:hypothetical protein
MSSGLRRISRAGFPAGEIVLAENGLDLAEMAVLAFVAEPDFFAVRQEDERHVEQIGITSALRLARAETDARALGFEHGKCTTLAIELRVVGPATVMERILVPHAEAIGQTQSVPFKSWSI